MYGQKQVSISAYFHTPLKFQELIRGYYGLNYREFIVLCSLNQLGEGDTDEISEQLAEGWPRNKVNAALKKLVDLELCTREKTVPEDQKRGFRYVYSSISAKEIKNQMLLAFEEFMIKAEQELNNLDYHLKSVDTKAYMRKKTKKDEIRKEWFKDEE